MSTVGLDRKSVYLWTLPMFHCDGWTFTWAVTAALATHVCLRVVEPHLVFRSISDHGVTHMCGAPIVLNMLANAPAKSKIPLSKAVEIATGGAAPPSAVIEAMETDGFRVTHLYGLTETYGPAIRCVSPRTTGLNLNCSNDRVVWPARASITALWKTRVSRTRRPWRMCPGTAKPSVK